MLAMTNDPSVELLRTISDVLDIRAVFPRVAEIANHVLPHDCLELVCHDRYDRVTLQARSTDAFPEFQQLTMAGEDEFQVVGDLRKSRLQVEHVDPPDFVDRVVAAGYRSLLNVRRRARGQVTLAFFSKRPDAYDQSDVPTANRIADYLALAVSHEQVAEEDRQRAEAGVRAERLDARVRSVAEGRDRKSGSGQPIGQSAAWRDVLKRTMQVASTETTVFLQGESGTGKEVLARFIHRTSPRHAKPFVAINCAALPETLLESELFGYERGAFTGAQLAKPGQIELASGGVLFLDEVSEMSPSAQAKFLRVLQEREFLRLGGTRLQKANVRVIAATNRDLREAVERGTFREDLYYRLQVFDIRIPPLRDRLGDIPLLAEGFLHDLGRSTGMRATDLTREAREALLAYDWPGNVRELQNVLERATILCEGGPITPHHLSLPSPSTPPASSTDLSAVERRTIDQVLRETDWNKSKAASRLGLTRTQLYVRIRKHDLQRPAVPASPVSPLCPA